MVGAAGSSDGVCAGTAGVSVALLVDAALPPALPAKLAASEEIVASEALVDSPAGGVSPAVASGGETPAGKPAAGRAGRRTST